jgi:hypothetical protein
MHDIRKIDIPEAIKNVIFFIVPSILILMLNDFSVHSQYSMP